MRLKTFSASWGDQGLRYYKGHAWYRTSVSISEGFRGRKIFLWFGGVDEKAKVWVNGKLLGESPGRAFAPFELEASEAVRFGETNRIAVLVTNSRLNELGTGGITAPVMFWATSGKASSGQGELRGER
jgi:beta-galactosidase/beta-glucuronidase